MEKPENPCADHDFLCGQLLIAMPNMGDPRFEHSVVLICAHDRDHAVGIIVNQPLAEISLLELLEQVEIAPIEDADQIPVFFGGPVQTQRGVVLHTLDYHISTTIVITPSVGLTATKDILNDIAGTRPGLIAPRRFLLAIGHAGWESGQLEQEIGMNVWAHCTPDEETIFDGAKVSTWKRALGKLGVTGAMLSPEWSTARNQNQPLN